MDATFRLPAVFDVAAVRQVYEDLKGTEGELSLDGTEVERVDVAGAQLLAALILSGRRVRLKASASLSDFLTATALGVVIPVER